MQVDKIKEMPAREMSGCENTLRQILRTLSQDERTHLNSQDKDALISSLLENSKKGIELRIRQQHCRPRSPVTHAQRLQETEFNTKRCVSHADNEEAPLFSIRKEQKQPQKKYQTFGSYKKRSIRPIDHYNLIYMVFFLMGMSTMLPWNFFIALSNFWNYRFREVQNPEVNNISHNEKSINDSLPSNTDLQKTFTSYLSIASNIPNAIFVIINAIYGSQFSARKRIGYSNLSIILLFIIITGLAAINSDSWQEMFLYLILTLVVLISATASIFTGSVFGLAGKFPPKYMGGAMLGQAVGGVFPAIAVIVILALNIPEQEVGFTCFLVATGFLVISVMTFYYANRSNFFQYFLRGCTTARKISETEDVETQQQQQLAESRRLPSTNLLHLIYKSKFYCVAIFFTSFFTLCVYPSLTVLIEPHAKTTSGSTDWGTRYFTPVSNFLLCSVGDSFGRILANNFNLLKTSKQRQTIALVLATLRALFIPLFLFCNACPDKRTLPVAFDSDEVFIVFMALLSLGNGFLGNFCMLHGPKIEEVNSELQEKIAMILVAFLVLGQAFGSFMSYFILQLL